MQMMVIYLWKSLALSERLKLFFFFLFCGSIASAQTNLTGMWIANDNGLYYVRQIGNDVWWAGFSAESPSGMYDLHKGLLFTSVIHGTLTGDTLAGTFVDVPKGQMLTYGPLTLAVNGNELESEAVPSAYRAVSWERATFVLPPPPDVFTLFDRVKKNQNAFEDHSLLDNLKPAKTKPVSVLGRITNTLASQSPPYGTDPYVIKIGIITFTNQVGG